MKSRLKLFLYISIFWLSVFILNRIIFTLITIDSEHSLTILEFIKALLYGFRLDASFVGYILLLSSVIFGFSTYTKVSGKIIIAIQYVFIPIVSCILLADMVLFSFWDSHLDSTAFIYADKIATITMSLKTKQIVLFSIVYIVYTAVLFVYFKYLLRHNTKISQTQKIYYAPVWLFIAGLMIIPMRGGLQQIPLNTGAVYFSKNSMSNMVAVNPVWNFAYSLKRLNKFSASYNYLPKEEAHTLFNDLFNRKQHTKNILKTKRPSIVLVVLESFNAAAVAESVDGRLVAPYFNALKKDGIFFKNLYATNTRSDKGLVGILSGFPVLPGISIMKYPQKSKSLPFIPEKLKENGYKNLTYIYGGDINFANMNSYIHLSGFETIISKSDFPSKYYNQKWGVHDEYTLDFLLDDWKQAPKPTFKALFTLSSHEPFDVPINTTFKDEYLNSIHYTDTCLGNFIKAAKASSIWNETLFIFIADHGTNWPNITNANSKRYHIPMIWTGGVLAVKDTVIDKYCSQTDLSVTLLNQLNINSSDFKFGKDIFNPDQKGFAFFNHNAGFSFIRENQEQYYDLNYKNFYTFTGIQSRSDSLIGKAYIQNLYDDYLIR